MQDFLEAIKHQGKNPEATREFFQGLGAGFIHLADKVVVGANFQLKRFHVEANLDFMKKVFKQMFKIKLVSTFSLRL